MIDFNNIDKLAQIPSMQPALNGVECRLIALPKLIETEKGNRLEFKFETMPDANGNTKGFNSNLLDPFKYDEEKYNSDDRYARIVNGNFSRLMHIFGALTPAYDQLKAIKIDNLKGYLDTALKLLDKDLINLQLKIVIGYNAKGYLQFPTVGDVISSIHKPKDLALSPRSNLTLTQPAFTRTSVTPDSDVEDEI